MRDYKNSIWNEADFSLNFQNKVFEIFEDLKSVIHSLIIVNSDMNYSSAQSINIFLDKNWSNIHDMKNAQTLLKIWISSKVDFFCIRYFKKNNGSWIPFNLNVNIPIQKYIFEIMLRFKYKEFPADEINNISTGYLTVLDGKPATYFEIFFSEIE